MIEAQNYITYSLPQIILNIAQKLGVQYIPKSTINNKLNSIIRKHIHIKISTFYIINIFLLPFNYFSLIKIKFKKIIDNKNFLC